MLSSTNVSTSSSASHYFSVRYRLSLSPSGSRRTANSQPDRRGTYPMKSYIIIVALLVSPGMAQQSKVTVAGASSSYVLSPGDQFSMEIADLEELNGKVHRV